MGFEVADDDSDECVLRVKSLKDPAEKGSFFCCSEMIILRSITSPIDRESSGRRKYYKARKGLWR